MKDIVIPKLETVEEVDFSIDAAKVKLANELNNKNKIGIKTRADMKSALSQIVVNDNRVVDEIIPDYSNIFDLEAEQDELLIGNLELTNEDQKFQITQTKSRLDQEFFSNGINNFNQMLIKQEQKRLLEVNQSLIIKQQEIIVKKYQQIEKKEAETERRRQNEKRAYELALQSRVAKYYALMSENKVNKSMDHEIRKFTEEDRMNRLSELEKRREIEQKQVIKKKERRQKMKTSFERYHIKETESNIIGFKQRKKRGSDG